MWEREARDCGIRRAGIFGRYGNAIHSGWRREALVPKIGIVQILEPGAPFAGVDRAPRRARPKGIQVLMKKQLAQGIWRVVRVDERAVRMYGRVGFVEPRGDAIRDVLLPVSGRIT